MYGFLAVMIAAAFWDNLSALHTTHRSQAVLRAHSWGFTGPENPNALLAAKYLCPLTALT